jgi:Fe-S cluster biogenesis protein NfuA
MFVQTEPTPNPDALKFKSRSQLVGNGSVWYDIDLAIKSNDFVKKLFRVAGVRYVLLQDHEVTVTKFPQWGWGEITDKVKQVMESDKCFIETGQTDQYCTDEICCAIRQIIQDEIRPAVQMDGGDIKFVKYQNGIVHLQMHGSCWGCPNNEATLGAVYNKIASKVPEIKQVRIV